LDLEIQRPVFQQTDDETYECDVMSMCVNMQTGFTWLRIGHSGGILWSR